MIPKGKFLRLWALCIFAWSIIVVKSLWAVVQLLLLRSKPYDLDLDLCTSKPVRVFGSWTFYVCSISTLWQIALNYSPEIIFLMRKQLGRPWIIGTTCVSFVCEESPLTKPFFNSKVLGHWLLTLKNDRFLLMCECEVSLPCVWAL